MSVLVKAAAAVQDRQQKYGHPSANFSRIANFWNTYLGVNVISSRDVAHMMSLVKISRDRHQPNEDNLVDIIGYTVTAEMLLEK